MAFQMTPISNAKKCNSTLRVNAPLESVKGGIII